MCRCSISNNTELSTNLLHVVVNNALLMVVDILNVCDLKYENFTIPFVLGSLIPDDGGSTHL
jgi:hypothetical protein